ncbi:Arsenate reductase [compost metagenome]
MMTLLHRNECSKSRCALDYMQHSSADYTVRDYVADPLSREELTTLLHKLGKEAKDIVRTGEELFKALYGDIELTKEQWLEVLVEHPILLERPILIDDDKAIVGRPPELVEEYVKAKQGK